MLLACSIMVMTVYAGKCFGTTYIIIVMPLNIHCYLLENTVDILDLVAYRCSDMMVAGTLL